MHNKTEKFITQLRHATPGEHSEVSKYQLNSQPKLNTFQSQCYGKIMFKVMSTRFHAAMPTFASLIQ